MDYVFWFKNSDSEILEDRIARTQATFEELYKEIAGSTCADGACPTRKM